MSAIIKCLPRRSLCSYLSVLFTSTCQDTVEVEQAEVEEPQDPGTYPTTAELAGGGDLVHQQQAAVLQQQELERDHRHGHHQAVGQDGTQLVQPVGEGCHDNHTTQLRRTRSLPKYFILKVIQ